MEKVTFCTTVDLADVNGVPICEGSVLQHISEGVVGVVQRIVRAGDKKPVIIASGIGDMYLRVSAGTTRVSNTYSKWKHFPHNKQTYEQRYFSWLYSKESKDYFSERMSKDEQLAITGILALMPEVSGDHDFPESTEDALRMLAQFLTHEK